MKSIKILAASLSFAAILASCTREPIPVGVDSKLPGVEEVAVAEAPYDGKSATIAWDGAKAVAAGAKSFTVEFVLSSKDSLEAAKPNNYDSTVSGLVQVDASQTSYSKKISGQVKGSVYYVRVRANYEKSRYSEWGYLMNPKTGDRARFKLGRGIISEGIEEPYLYKITPTSSGLIIKWDLIQDVTAYEIQYRKASEDSWTTVSCGADDNNYKVSGLPSETEYVVRAKSYIADEGSEYCDEQIVKTRQPGSFPTSITNADELVAWLEAGIVEVDASQTFKLETDVDLTGTSFVPMDEPLMGAFDGQGHTISGVSTNLFYQNDGTIKNLNVKGNVKIATDSPSFGAFVLTNNGTISNCSSEVNVEYTTKENCDIFIGGFCCENNGKLDNVTNAGNVTVNHTGDLSSDYYDRIICIGGVAASSTNELTECKNTGSVSYVSSAPVVGPAVAGIAGFIGGKAVKCTNKGAVTLQYPYSKADAGKGYLPQLEGKTFNANSYYGTPAAAGIAAYSYSATPAEPLLDECVNDGAVNFTATSIDKYTTTVQRIQAAGIIANPWGLIRNCTNNGALTFAANTTTGSASSGTCLFCCGGIGGGSWFEASQDVTNYEGCINNGDIEFVKYDKVGSSNSTCGGIVGWPGAEGSRSNVTKNCTNNGAISFRGTGKARVGGIHGGSGAMNGCINNGEVHCYSADANSAIGGLAGFSSNGLTIQNCQSRGPVISDIEMQTGVAGGVGNLGNADNSGKFTNCIIATKVVNASADNSKTGMIVGYFNGTSKSTPIGASGAVKVSGKIQFDGKATALTSGNFTSYLVGTANASADNHKVNAVFDTTPYVDPDEGDEEPETPSISAPKNVVVSILYNSVKVSWDAVEGAEWYVVDYKKADSEEWTSAPKVETNECVLEGLEHGTSYSFRIRAFASTGSGYSDVTSGNTLPAVNLTVPVVTPAAPEAASCVINWAAITGATSYSVEYKEAASDTWSTAIKVETNTCEIKSLKPSTLYDVRVKALGEGGNEGEWGSAQFTTDKISFTYPLSIADGDTFAEWINTAAAVCVEGNVVTLTSDIDLAGKTLESVSTFAGTLDGNGKTIKNLKLDGVPIFKQNTGTIKNLIIDASCTVSAVAGNFAVIAAENAGSVENCVNNAAITLGDYASLTYLGAIVGSNTGKVENCTNNGNITINATTTTSNSCFGGVVGQFAGKSGVASVSGCKNTGKISYSVATTPKNPIIGGVVGGTTPHATGKSAAAATRKTKVPNVGIVYGCSNTAEISVAWPTNGGGSYTNLGGVVGYIEGDVQNCTNEGTVKLETSTNTAASNSRPSVGGVAGYIVYSAKDLVNKGKVVVAGCYAAGTDGAAAAGGMFQPCFGGVIGGVGYGYNEIQPDESVEGCKNYGELDFKPVQKENGGTKSNTGAVIGYSATNSIKDCHNYGTACLSSAHKAAYAGGVVGLGYNAEVSSCTNEGVLTFDGRSSILGSNTTNGYSYQAYCGGIVGYASAGCTIKDCENKAVINFKDYVNTTALSYLGGILGSYSGSLKMENCKNTADITSTATCALAFGGVSGAFNGVMNSCSNSGKLDCATNTAPSGKETEVGGVIGYANAIISNCSSTGSITTGVSGSFAGGLVGGFGASGANGSYPANVRQFDTCTADCTISGPATVGSIIGHFRDANAGVTVYYKGMTIGSALTSAPLCGNLNGNTMTEGTAE